LSIEVSVDVIIWGYSLNTCIHVVMILHFRISFVACGNSMIFFVCL
jgi:hypothetical protein